MLLIYIWRQIQPEMKDVAVNEVYSLPVPQEQSVGLGWAGKKNNSSSSKQLVLAADDFVRLFIRRNHPNRHICSVVPLTSLT